MRRCNPPKTALPAFNMCIWYSTFYPRSDPYTLKILKLKPWWNNGFHPWEVFFPDHRCVGQRSPRPYINIALSHKQIQLANMANYNSNIFPFLPALSFRKVFSTWAMLSGTIAFKRSLAPKLVLPLVINLSYVQEFEITYWNETWWVLMSHSCQYKDLPDPDEFVRVVLANIEHGGICKELMIKELFLLLWKHVFHKTIWQHGSHPFPFYNLDSAHLLGRFCLSRKEPRWGERREHCCWEDLCLQILGFLGMICYINTGCFGSWKLKHLTEERKAWRAKCKWWLNTGP